MMSGWRKKMKINGMPSLAVSRWAIGLVLMLLVASATGCSCKRTDKGGDGTDSVAADSVPQVPTRTDQTVCLTDDNDTLTRCTSLILMDVDDNTVLVEKNANQRTNVASLTKVMTLLTFLEMCTPADLDSTYAPTEQMLSNGVWQQAATRARIYPDEVCNVRELLYAMILPSGADAALCLANYIAGSEEKFVARMNELAQQMHLSNTHFTNVSGLHDEHSYSSAQDMAQIMRRALANPLAREVLSTSEYVMIPTRQHKRGIHLRHTVFQRVRRVREQEGDTTMFIPIDGGKTGFTSEAGQCLATYHVDQRGRTTVCVVCGSPKREPLQSVYDTMTAYRIARR